MKRMCANVVMRFLLSVLLDSRPGAPERDDSAVSYLDSSILHRPGPQEPNLPVRHDRAWPAGQAVRVQRMLLGGGQRHRGRDREGGVAAMPPLRGLTFPCSCSLFVLW